MAQTKCRQCDKEFYVKPSWRKKGWGKYCSQACNGESQKKGEVFACHRCGKEIYRSLLDQQKSRSGKYFCNKSCQTVWRNAEVHTGPNHPNWTTGQASYRDRLRRSGQKQECKRCRTTDKRVLSVHHMDRNRDNNELANLIFLCHNCHYLVHKFDDEAKGYITA